jgi:ankyrin repeat protein
VTIDQSDLTSDLHFAASNGDIKKVEDLIAKGANIHHFDTSSKSALYHAVESGNRQLVHWLIEEGANVNSHNSDYAGETPLSIAAELGEFGIAKLLLKSGANPYLKGSMWNDALDRAESRKDELGDKIKTLIIREAPPSKERLKRNYHRN